MIRTDGKRTVASPPVDRPPGTCPECASADGRKPVGSGELRRVCANPWHNYNERTTA